MQVDWRRGSSTTLSAAGGLRGLRAFGFFGRFAFCFGSGALRRPGAKPHARTAFLCLPALPQL
jgi:hypothetical protein